MSPGCFKDRWLCVMVLLYAVWHLNPVLGFQSSRYGPGVMQRTIRWKGSGRRRRHLGPRCEFLYRQGTPVQITECTGRGATSKHLSTQTLPANSKVRANRRANKIEHSNWSFQPIQTYSVTNMPDPTRVVSDSGDIRTEKDVTAVASANINNNQMILCAKESVVSQHNAQSELQGDLQIVYVDDQIVVVNKPSGVMSVPGPRRQLCILDQVFNIYGDLSLDEQQRNTAMDQMVVHRLDRDTSGLVVYARTQDALRQLHEDFRFRRVKKQYMALVCGHVIVDEGEINLSLARDHLHPPFMRVATPDSEQTAQEYLQDSDKKNHQGFLRMIGTAAKDSFTKFQVLSREMWEGHLPVTRILLYPETGRTHQLRVHCAAMGHPIVADPIYGYRGEGSPNAGFTEKDMDMVFSGDNNLQVSPRAGLELQREIAELAEENGINLCLHAQQLHIRHPVSRAPLCLRAPSPF
jgi:tRNA pseudouridine32 synthase/23S rRNA pseudouridine746 synthase